MSDNFHKIAATEVARFDSLFSEKKIDKRFLEFAKAEIETYYNAVICKIIKANFSNKGIDDMYPDYGEVWDKMYQSAPITAELFRHNYGYNYADIFIKNYCSYIEKKKSGRDFAPNSEVEYNNALIERINQKIEDPIAKQLYLINYLTMVRLNNKTFTSHI